MKYLIVSIDTEEDMPHWRPERTLSTRNIRSLPKLQKLFTKHGIEPTYLVNQPVLENDDSLNVIRDIASSERCEIGAHLHSWNTPPITDEEKAGKATYLCNQSKDIIKRKLSGFTELFFDKIGHHPKSYRAGRYGFGGNSAQILAELGYKVDSSIAPMMNFGIDGGPNFRKYDPHPFWINESAENGLIELPISISLVHRFPNIFTDFYFRIPEWSKIRGILHRLNIARLLWLRPTTYSFNEMKQLADFIVDRLKVPILNMMFHSSEACAGASPYNVSERDVEAFLGRMDAIFSYLINKKQMQSVTMTGFLKLCSSDRGNEIFGKELLNIDIF